MDAMTSFELEAQRRREVIGSDRDRRWTRIAAPTETVEGRIVEPRRSRRALVVETGCEPAPLARQAAG
jgi:hypothetical protein